MGGKQSTQAGAPAAMAGDTGASSPAAVAPPPSPPPPPPPPPKDFNWGDSPEYPPEDEIASEELALQSWAYCKSKPNAAKHYRSDLDEKKRRAALMWRKRQSFIELDCGEDSFFVSNTYRTIGIADGVGGWRDQGIDPTVMSNSIMRAAKLFSETHRKEYDPEIIMQSAFDKVIHEKWAPGGSTTACVASLRRGNDGGYLLDVANLGDSGLMVIRNKRMIHRVHEKVHNLSSPFQLSIVPKSLKAAVFADAVSDCVRETIPVKEGDVIVMGTDGLFDNRFNSQIVTDAGWACPEESSPLYNIPLFGMVFGVFFDHKSDYVDPYRITQRLVNDAFKASIGKNGDTPWAVLLRDFGVKNVEGGKVDDVTVVLSRVTTRAEMMNVDTW